MTTTHTQAKPDTSQFVTISSDLFGGVTFTARIVDRYRRRPSDEMTIEFVTDDGMEVTALEDDFQIGPLA